MKTRFVKSSFLLFAILALFSFNSCATTSLVEDDLNSYQPHSDQSLLTVMTQQEIVEMTISTELDSLLIKRKKAEYQNADFSFIDERGVAHNFFAKVKPRGKFRRMTCDFPPLKLKFAKTELEAAGLSGMNELKLVTHCMDDKDISKSLIMREYLMYKLYNELTPNSLRVQLAKITYLDKNNPDYRMIRYGFLIEDEEELSQRTGGKVMNDKMGTDPATLNPTHEKIAAVFQYMIGNTDWNIQMLRNVEILEKKDGSLVPVPYDFDFAGTVAAPYARPNVDVGQRRVGQRVFMGNASSAKELYSTLSYFRTKKQRLLNMVNDFTAMDLESRQVIMDYLESFFVEIETQESAQVYMFDRTANSGTILTLDR